MRLATLLLLFSLAGCWGHEEYQLPDRPMRRDGTMLCSDAVSGGGVAIVAGELKCFAVTLIRDDLFPIRPGTIPMAAKKKTSPKLFCFVLMPFKAEFDDIYDHGIKAACEETHAVYCERVDKQIYAERWLDRIYNQISKADIIVAEMTEENLNVFYEVGYAHALGKQTILLSQTVDKIPSDLLAYNHVVYGKSITKLKSLLTPQIQWYVDNGIGGESQSRAELEVSINGQRLDTAKSAEENGKFRCGDELLVTIQNVSNHVLMATDYFVVFETSNSLRLKTPEPDPFNYPVVKLGHRLQHSLQFFESLFPGQADSKSVDFHRSAAYEPDDETVSLKVFTARGPMEFPIVLYGKQADDGPGPMFIS